METSAVTATDTTGTAEQTLGTIASTLKGFDWEKTALLVLLLVGCLVIMRILLSLARRAVERTNLDKSAHRFLLSGLKVILWLITVCILLGYLGVPISSLVAVLGVVGLALSLAIQGVLSNLAGGIMLLVSKPFSAGDYVEASGVSGTVTEVGMVYTKFSTVDNKVIAIPNGQLAGEKIINYTAAEKRQLELKFNLSYEADPDTVKACIARVVGVQAMALFSPEPLIRVNDYKESAVEYILRVWCATDDYWPLRYDLLEQIKVEFDKAGVEMTYNHLNVHLK